jgi:hypothetical protein
MRYFLWKIAGAEIELLKKAGKQSQYSFYLIGLFYLTIIIISAIGFLGFFWGVFDSIIPTLLGGSILTFIVTNIYRLSLINSLPITPVKEKKSLIFTYIVRYFMAVLFALFVSKSFEMVIFNIVKKTSLYFYDGHNSYISHLIETNKKELWLWIVTVIITLIFVLPILLKQRLNKSKDQYFLIKKLRDREIVKEDYQKYLVTKNEILKHVYQQYINLANSFFEHKDGLYYNQQLSDEINKIKSQLNAKTFVQHPKKFIDEPFNTKRIDNNKKLKNSQDFLESILSK